MWASAEMPTEGVGARRGIQHVHTPGLVCGYGYMNLNIALVEPEIHWNIECLLTARQLRGIKKRLKR
jgi:hypothetical protein